MNHLHKNCVGADKKCRLSGPTWTYGVRTLRGAWLVDLRSVGTSRAQPGTLQKLMLQSLVSPNPIILYNNNYTHKCIHFLYFYICILISEELRSTYFT